MKTIFTIVFILVVITSMAVYLDRFYLAQYSPISNSGFTEKLVNTTEGSFNTTEVQIQKPASLSQPINDTDFQEDVTHNSSHQRAIELDVSELSTLTMGDWVTLPLTYGSITLKVKSKDQRDGHQTLIVTDVDSGHNSVITITDNAVFGTLTTDNRNHQLTAFKPTQSSLDQSNVYSGSVQEEHPEHELFSQLRESDELFPNAEDLLNQTEHFHSLKDVHHHEHLPHHHEH